MAWAASGGSACPVTVSVGTGVFAALAQFGLRAPDGLGQAGAAAVCPPHRPEGPAWSPCAPSVGGTGSCPAHKSREGSPTRPSGLSRQVPLKET